MDHRNERQKDNFAGKLTVFGIIVIVLVFLWGIASTSSLPTL